MLATTSRAALAEPRVDPAADAVALGAARLARLRALAQMTVSRGCTLGEAIAAQTKLAEVMARTGSRRGNCKSVRRGGAAQLVAGDRDRESLLRRIDRLTPCIDLANVVPLAPAQPALGVEHHQPPVALKRLSSDAPADCCVHILTAVLDFMTKVPRQSVLADGQCPRDCW